MEVGLQYLSLFYEDKLSDHFQSYTRYRLDHFIWILFHLNNSSVIEKYMGISWQSGYKAYMGVRLVLSIIRHHLKDQLVNKWIDTTDLLVALGAVGGLWQAISIPRYFIQSTFSTKHHATGIVVNSSDQVNQYAYHAILLAVPLVKWCHNKWKRSKGIGHGCDLCGRLVPLMSVNGNCYVCQAMYNQRL